MQINDKLYCKNLLVQKINHFKIDQLTKFQKCYLTAIALIQAIVSSRQCYLLSRGYNRLSQNDIIILKVILRSNSNRKFKFS